MGFSPVWFGLSEDLPWILYFSQVRERGGAEITEEEKESCLKNLAPGTPPLTVLSFTNAFHGRTMGKSRMLVIKVQIF